MGRELKDGDEVLWTIFPVLLFDGKLLVDVELVGSNVCQVKDDARAEAQRQRVGGDNGGAGLVDITNHEVGVVVHVDATELSTIALQHSKAIEPQTAVE